MLELQRWREKRGLSFNLKPKFWPFDVTLADPESGLSVGDRVSVELARPLFFDDAGQRITV